MVGPDADRPGSVTAVTYQTTCKGCGTEFVADTEDELITQVQAHISDRHARGHAPSREQVRAVLRAREEPGGKHPRIDPHSG